MIKDIIKKIDIIKDIDKKIEIINELKKELHKISPFKDQPVDCVLWVKHDRTKANDYNPNIVAPPEMRLLELSILSDGFTQPIVAWDTKDKFEIVDGFHRHIVGKTHKEVSKRLNGYIPITIVNEDRLDKGDRISSTIRHNRARGKHQIASMSEIVIELKKRNWKEERIARELGMEQDEILRLCQISGLSELFSDQDFSKSWDIENATPDYTQLSDDIGTYGKVVEDFRTINTDDKDRIFHKWEKWECFKAGFYATSKEGMTKEQCEQAYCDFLKDTKLFAKTLNKIIKEWKYSCEHYLTNKSMNRIAYLGQAALSYALGIPAVFRSGFSLLTEEQQKKANETALIYLNKWMKANGRKELTMKEALSDGQSNLY